MSIGLALVRLAGSQNGNLTIEQLWAGGLSRGMIKTRADRGDLYRQFPRVYSVGDPSLIPLCRETAAVLSLGAGAQLGRRSAGAVWEITSADQPLIDVVVVGNPRRRPGVRIHRVTSLHPDDVRTHANVRLTAPARTIIDLAVDAPADEVERAIAAAMAQRRLKEYELREALTRIPANHSGGAIVKRLLDLEGGPVLTRSAKERKLRKLLRAANLPMPRANTKLLGIEVDFHWPEHGLVVEVDAFGTHGSRRSFERDRRRDQVLTTRAGVVVLRFTVDQLDREPLLVVATIAQALAIRDAKAA